MHEHALMTRRAAIGAAATASLALAAGRLPARAPKPLFTISLAQWSLHRTLGAGAMTNLDFPRVALERFGIDAVEYVNSFFKDKARDRAYLKELKARCDDLGVTSVLIMCDGEGALGDADEKQRASAVENHRKWVEAARFLGCHSIRVNAQSSGTDEDQQARAADGLRRLCAIGDEHDINIIVENHGGLSSNGSWLSETIRRVDHPRIGTLPDFGNFCMDWSRKDDPDAWYDRYKGVEQMMPAARAVSAKSYDFDGRGNETTIDYRRMIKIVLAAGYHGRVGVEYEGSRLSEDQGIIATKRLLERVRDELAG